jgi:pyruvate-formate lyase
MLPTTCHVYFGSVTGAMPTDAKREAPLSEGISPVQGADRNGPTAVLKSAAKMDHVRTGGTLLNMKFTPSLLEDDEGVEPRGARADPTSKWTATTSSSTWSRADTLRKAQADPEAHRGLIVRVAGYSDYFCDLSEALQEEIIARTEHDRV